MWIRCCVSGSRGALWLLVACLLAVVMHAVAHAVPHAAQRFVWVSAQLFGVACTAYGQEDGQQDLAGPTLPGPGACLPDQVCYAVLSAPGPIVLAGTGL